MSGLEVPQDMWAESAVVSCAVASCRGARLAADRLDAGDFYRPRHAALFKAAVDLGDVEDCEERIRLVAAATSVAVETVRTMVEDRPVMWDTSGGFARRVKSASRRRALMTLCSDLYNAIGSGASLEDVAGQAHQLEAVLL